MTKHQSHLQSTDAPLSCARKAANRRGPRRPAMNADAKQTQLRTCLSAILLGVASDRARPALPVVARNR